MTRKAMPTRGVGRGMPTLRVRKGNIEMKNKKEDIIHACHFASPSQASRSSHWNNAHAEECFMDQDVKQWTDTPRADAMEHF
jgi:hypothetical protein